MRTYIPFRLLLVPAALLVGACEDSSSIQEPPALEADVPMLQEAPVGAARASLLDDGSHWADGYVRATNPTSASYTPSATYAFNRAGGVITVKRPAGTTGRYVVTFPGLSALLGATSTVKVTGYGANNTYCNGVSAYLASDKVEVRCYRPGTGAPVNAAFTVLVSRAAADRAFAYAHQATATEYSPHAQGSWNPAGAIKIQRVGVGEYQVVFSNLRSQLPVASAHLQVSAAGAGKGHCTNSDWGGNTDLTIYVVCHTPAGNLIDSKFTVIYLVPSSHLAYALADQESATTYSPQPSLTSNPAGGSVSINRSATGTYSIRWTGADPEILGAGNVQVAAVGNSRCKVTGQGAESAQVQCFAPTGALVDSYYSVLLGS